MTMLRPTLEQLSRPMVSPTKLETHTYEIEIVDFSSASTNKVAVEFRNLKKIELHPIEWDGLIVLSNPKKDKERIDISVGNIIDIQTISEMKGHVMKKEDLMIQITYRDNNNSSNQDNVITINLNDKHVSECLQLIESVRKNELDDKYWTYRSLIFPLNNNQTKTIDIYPLAPFLAEGEEIIWYEGGTEGVLHKKFVWIHALTNYRVFYYDYKKHGGIMVLLPALEDVVVNNQRRTSNTDSVGFYSRSYHSLSGVRNTKGTSVTIGDVVLIAEGKPYITFNQVADPHGLARVVKSIKKQQTHMRIGGQVQTKPIGEEQTKFSQLDNKIQVIQTKTVTSNGNKIVNVICNKCNNSNNPKGSKFCNKCGFKLQNNCTNCGNINPENSAFCNQCGFALN